MLVKANKPGLEYITKLMKELHHCVNAHNEGIASKGKGEAQTQGPQNRTDFIIEMPTGEYRLV